MLEIVNAGFNGLTVLVCFYTIWEMYFVDKGAGKREEESKKPEIC